MNITSDEGDSLYRGSEEGGGRLNVSVQDDTFDPSACINQATKLLHVMRNIIGTN